MPPAPPSTEEIAINTLRFLAVDMVETARSGHPGAPMGQAPMAFTLFARHLRFDPTDPQWPNRDRFVLSCGHASALLYGLLHLAGYELGLDQLRQFRQLHSLTPGHPEYRLTPGVETTTGPLGQGLATAVGMAIAERLLADRFNRDGFRLFDHRVWVLASDGDLMEGVSAEASSLAGHLGLGKLNVLYDANRITIDGPTDLAFSEDVAERYRAYGWHTLSVEDGTDLEAIDRALGEAAGEERPSLIVVRTEIGYGSPNKQNSAASHGAPLGAEEVALTKRALGWPLEPPFFVPEEAYAAFAEARERGSEAQRSWQDTIESYAKAHPDLYEELERRSAARLPAGYRSSLPTFDPEDSKIATRKASGVVLNALAESMPELVGGSADLTGSNNTTIDGAPVFPRPAGRNFHFGVREHAMAAAMNGMALSGLLRPFGGTFLIFSDYMRPSMRLAALMGLPVLYVLTHDSIFLGEDGPTHQPISHLASLRAIPNLVVLRPADANEVAAAWAVALERSSGPTALALSRQGLPILPGTAEAALDGVARGAYVLRDSDSERPDIVLIATGSEVTLAVEAAGELAEGGIAARVVSMPSTELFLDQGDEYRRRVLPPDIPRLAIEAASAFGWREFVGEHGDVLAIDRFGASAPAAALAEEYGFTASAVKARVEALLDRCR